MTHDASARSTVRGLEAELGVECHFAGDRISSLLERDAWAVADELGVLRAS